MKNGIFLAGNILIDNIKIIDNYPNKLALTQIRSLQKALGGLVAMELIIKQPYQLRMQRL